MTKSILSVPKYLIVLGAAVCALGVSYALSHSYFDTALQLGMLKTVEVEFTELSPRGEEGGYAVPASGSSGSSGGTTPSYGSRDDDDDPRCTQPPDLDLRDLQFRRASTNEVVNQNQLIVGETYVPLMIIRNVSCTPTDAVFSPGRISTPSGAVSNTYYFNSQYGSNGRFQVLANLNIPSYNNLRVNQLGPIPPTSFGYDQRYIISGTYTIGSQFRAGSDINNIYYAFPAVTFTAADIGTRNFAVTLDAQCDNPNAWGCIYEINGGNYRDSYSEPYTVINPAIDLGTFLMPNPNTLSDDNLNSTREITTGQQVGLYWKQHLVDINTCTGSSISNNSGGNPNDFTGRADIVNLTPTLESQLPAPRAQVDININEPAPGVSYTYVITCQALNSTVMVSDSVIIANGVVIPPNPPTTPPPPTTNPTTPPPPTTPTTPLPPTITTPIIEEPPVDTVPPVINYPRVPPNLLPGVNDLNHPPNTSGINIPFNINNLGPNDTLGYSTTVFINEVQYGTTPRLSIARRGNSTPHTQYAAWDGPSTSQVVPYRVCVSHPDMRPHRCSSASITVVAVPPLPICNDGFDNDGDGLVDYPADPGCTDSIDNDERDTPPPPPPPPPQCSDNSDNDGDGLVDEQDRGCWSDPYNSSTYNPNDNDEFNPRYPICNLLSFSPSTLDRGTNTTLSWATTDATSISYATSRGASGTLTPMDGFRSFSLMDVGTHTFTLTLRSSDNLTNSCSTSVTVNAAPTITATPAVIRQGGVVDVTWDPNGGTNCTLLPTNLFGGQNATASGSTSVSPSGDVTVTITCDGGVRADADIRVIPEIFET